MQAYQNLEKTFNRIHHLDHLGAIAGWDEAVMMPEGGGEARAQAMAELSVVKNEILQEKSLGDLFAQANEDSSLSDWQKSNLREMNRMWKNSTAIPTDLVEKLSLAASKSEQAWRKLRPENDWKSFLPLFEEVLNLTREEAGLRSEVDGTSLYDSMLNLYDPGLKTCDVDPIFKQLKSFLPNFTQQVLEKQKNEKFVEAKGPFCVNAQRDLGLEMMKNIGFNFHHGRLDVSHHPFCGGVAKDVRITTRYTEHDFCESFMGILHESGHASYEQGLPHDWIQQPVGEARGMSIHESQSLLFEMQVGRSFEFLSYFAPKMKSWLEKSNTPEEFWQPENLFQFYTRVNPDFIRVNADEVTYPAHIILRYEIEKDLLEGKLQAKDLPEVWNAKMKEYLGLETKDNYKDGCMQDVHWPSGAIGYFPTYSLGAITAAQIFATIRKEIPEVLNQIKNGEFQAMRDWLTDKLWSQASFYSTSDLVKHVTGEKLKVDAFEEHLTARYLNWQHL